MPAGYWKKSKACQTVEDSKTLSLEMGIMKLSDGGPPQPPKKPSVSLEMGVRNRQQTDGNFFIGC